MKDIIYKFLIICILSIVVLSVGCKKDDATQNSFTLKSKAYVLNYGAIDSWGATTHNPITYNYLLFLSTTGIIYNNTSQDYTGTGSFIALNLISRNPLELNPGVYTFDGFASHDSLTIDEGLVGINYNLTTNQPDSSLYDIKTGIVEVAKRNGFYEFTIDIYFKDSTAKLTEVKGYYNGILDLHKITQKKKERYDKQLLSK